MSVERFHAVVGSNRAFAQAVSQFEQDAARQPEAQDLTGLYRSAVTAALDGNTDVVSFACGYSLCLGEIRSRTEDGFSAWARSFGKGNTPPVYALATAEYTLGRNLHSGRFVFSTDPAANGLFDGPSAGTGTVLRPAAVEAMAREAGFSRVTILPV